MCPHHHRRPNQHHDHDHQSALSSVCYMHIRLGGCTSVRPIIARGTANQVPLPPTRRVAPSASVRHIGCLSDVASTL